MTMHHVTLRGAAARGSTVSASVLHGLLGALLEGCQGAVRLAFERGSVGSTTASAWIERSVDFDILGIECGSTRIVVEAPALTDVVPATLAGAAAMLAAETTAFDLFVAGIRDAVRLEEDSERFDVPLLETYGKLGDVLALGFDEIALGDDPSCRLDAAAFEAIAALRRRAPMPRQVRVAGRLEPVAHDPRAFVLQLPEGAMHGIAVSNAGAEQLQRLLGARVVVSGLAVFRPSGRVARLEASRIDAADDRASIWEQMPRPLLEAAEPMARYHVRQGPRSGLAAIMGKWPGDETDEEIAEILERLS